MKKVLINKPIHQASIDKLSQQVEVLTPFSAPAEEVAAMLSDVNGLILCAGLNVTAEMMDGFHSIQVIGRHGAGLDFLDLQAATQRNIPVVYTPEGPTESTAEHAFLLMLAAARKLAFLDQATRSGNFHVRDRVVGRELAGAKVGVIGYGRIGKRFAEMCRAALHMQVYAYDPYLDPSTLQTTDVIWMEDLIEMAEQVDVLSIHCPSTPQTRHLVNRAVLEALGPRGFLVSASRGAIVDENALIEALQNEHISGAGIDVYDPEPPAKDNPLFALQNVVLTPHLASFTDEGRRRMGMMIVEDVLRVLNGERPLYWANPEISAEFSR